MDKSRQIAGLLGPAIIVTTVTETIHSNIWAGNTAAGVYFNGTVLFVAGLAIVRAHNVWVRKWPVLVTLAGWFILLLGLFRMFAPELQLQGAQSASVWLLPSTIVLLTGGIVLTFNAYRPERSNAGRRRKGT